MVLSGEANAGWNPLILSTIAGMSTCLGALVVFCHPIDDGDLGSNDDASEDCMDVNASLDRIDSSNFQLCQEQKKLPRTFVDRFRGRRKVSPLTMTFSLALAGSVMVTVSIVSIGPECLAASSMPQNPYQGIETHQNNSFFIFGITLMPIYSWIFLHRLLSFGMGSISYFIMSKYAFPAPEEVLSTHPQFLLNSTNTNHHQQNDYPVVDTHCDDIEDKRERFFHHSRQEGSNSLMSKVEWTNTSLVRRSGSFGEDEIQVKGNPINVKDNESMSNGKEKWGFYPLRSTCLTFLRNLSTGSDLTTSEARRANRVAMLLFFSLLIHNFPEGLAVAASTLESDQLGLTVTVGIMIHNIPEGIAIAIPCLKARPDSPCLSFILASISGLAEPAGAFLSMILLRGSNQINGDVEKQGSLENVLAFVAGIMITVSFLELFPEARRHAADCSSGKKVFYSGILMGFIVMVATEFGMSF